MPRGIYKRNKKYLHFLKRHIETIRKKFPNEFRKTCIERYSQGETATSIAKNMGCSSYIIRYWVKRKGYMLNHASKNTNYLNELTNIEKSYIAGILDGEGSVVIVRPKNKSPWLQIGIANTNKELIDWLYQRLKGHLGSHKKPKKSYKLCWTWRATTHQAGEILKILLPFLIVKKQKTIEALKYFNY